METPISTGICEWCKDEYDNPSETPLFKFGKRTACGECCNAWHNEKAMYLSAYGED